MPGGLGGPLLLTTDAVGGVWRYTADLVRGLDARGVGCVVAVLGPKASGAQVRDVESVKGARVVQTGLPLDWTAEDAAALAHASERLAALAALTGAASVHLHAPALVGEARWAAPVVAVGHSCVGTWWAAVRGGALPEDLAWRAAATGAGLHRAAAVLAPSAAQARAMRELYGTMPIAVVHNGVAPRQPVRGGRERAVLTAGRLWDEGKGMAALDVAAGRLGAPVRAAGPLEGPNGARIGLAHIEALGVLDAEGMQRAFGAARVFASLARYEPFGLAVLEAAQAGMRLVLSDIPSFRELWDGAATFVAPGEDPVPALHAALDAPGDGGAADRAGHYTLDAMVDGTLAVHRAMLVAA